MRLILFIFSIILFVVAVTLALALFLYILGSRRWIDIYSGNGRDE